MIPFKVKYKHKTIPFDVSTSYDELTVQQMLNINAWDGTELSELLQIVTGLPDEIIDNLQDDYDGINTIASRLGWLTKPVYFMSKDYEQVVPESLLGYAVPTSLEHETFGQKISLQSYLMNADKKGMSILECIPMTLAIYFQPIIEDRDYDEGRAMKLSSRLATANLKDAWAVTDFFLRNSNQLSSERLSKCPTFPTNELMQLVSGNLKRLAYLLLLTHWPEATYSDMTKYCYRGIKTFLQN